MEKDWKMVLFTGDELKAVIAKELLKENDIDAVILNRKDSSYSFGDIEVYVHESNEEKAEEILKQLKAGDN